MIDHLELHTRNVEASLDFYVHVLAPLGYVPINDGAARGVGDDSGLEIFLVAGDRPTNVHFAFKAVTRAMVDEVYEIARRAGYGLDRPPALAPEIHPDYYAGYLRDPDRRLVEFVCHAPA